jgi:hypothetical protein
MKTINHYLIGFVLFGAVTLSSCSSSKSSSSKGYFKSNSAPATTNAFTPAAPAIDKSQFVTFSRELQMKLAAYNIDPKRVQFYIDQKLILTRNLDSGKAEVSSGTIRFINGKKINEIVIPAYTPGIIESADLNGIRVSFEPGSSFLFVPAEGEDKFVVSGNNWDNGTVEVPYERTIYKASSGPTGNIADMKLVVKLADVNVSDKKTRTLPGRKIGL